jgi:hypothetical protein
MDGDGVVGAEDVADGGEAAAQNLHGRVRAAYSKGGRGLCHAELQEPGVHAEQLRHGTSRSWFSLRTNLDGYGGET